MSRKCHEVDYTIIGHDMQLVEVELDPGETVIAEAGAMTYMEEGIAFTKKLGVGFFGGDGFILEKLSGNGMVFVHAGGTVIEKQLNNETLRVDTGCLVAFQPSVDYDIERAGNLKSMIFGGEGLFMATLRGAGKVWLQSLPFSRMADRVIACAPSSGGSDKGEGSVQY